MSVRTNRLIKPLRYSADEGGDVRPGFECEAALATPAARAAISLRLSHAVMTAMAARAAPHHIAPVPQSPTPRT
jgi:hypothetical protein